MNLNQKKLSIWPTGTVLIIIFFLIGLSIGQKIFSPEKTSTSSDESGQIRLGEGRLTNPLLECDVAGGTIDSGKVYFDKELRSYVSAISAMNGSTSVYFRDMNNGPVIEINTSDKFMPASLLKVPVMMSYFKKAELDPSILKEKITFTSELDLGFVQTIPPEKKLKVGESYTISELIDQMITYSDNQALALLWPIISVDEYKKLYSELGVDEKVVEDPTYSISVKEYSRFFRILFNSSYLSQTYSEKALKILSESKFSEGIKKKLPAGLIVANKFGERQITTNETQIHDCGIVYYPKHPYLLCIMTRGTNQKKLISTISDISEYIYKKIDSKYEEDLTGF